MAKFALAAVCLLLTIAARPGSAQVASPPPPAATQAPPPPPPVTAAPMAVAPQAPAVTAAPAVQAPPPVTSAPPVVTAAPAPQVVATPPVTAAPVVTAAPAPKAVATPPVVTPVAVAAPAPKAAATPPTTAAPVAKAAPAPAPVATAAAKAAPAPAPGSSAVLPGVLPFPLAATPAPAPAPVTPPRMCNNGPPKCQLFIEDALCCGAAEGLVTDSHYVKLDVLCTEYVVIPQGCVTVAPVLPNITVNSAFQPAGVASTFHDFIVDFQKDANFAPGPFVGNVVLTLEALRNASSANYNPTCAQAISPCLYNGTLYNQTVPGAPISITVLDNLDYVEGYLGLPSLPTDTLGWSTNATNPAICNQQDVGSLPPSFYTGGFVNYTGYQNQCNTTRTILDTYQFCEDYTLPFENKTLHNLPPSSPAPRVPGPSLGPSSRMGIPL